MQRERRICLVLPLNYICLERPRTTGDVPRSAQSSAERRQERGLSPGTSGGESESRGRGQQEHKWAKTISQRAYVGQRAAVLHCLLSSSGFYHCWGVLAGGESARDRGKERIRKRQTPWLPPSAEAASCRATLLFHLETRRREERGSPLQKMVWSHKHTGEQPKRGSEEAVKRQI